MTVTCIRVIAAGPASAALATCTFTLAIPCAAPRHRSAPFFSTTRVHNLLWHGWCKAVRVPLMRLESELLRPEMAPAGHVRNFRSKQLSSLSWLCLTVAESIASAAAIIEPNTAKATPSRSRLTLPSGRAGVVLRFIADRSRLSTLQLLSRPPKIQLRREPTTT
jgi:hypothetical protein